jgi:phospholipase/carboxylesterase
MSPHRRDFLRAVAALVAMSVPARARGDDLTPGEHPIGLEHDRDGVLYIPQGYSSGVPLPLVVMFHGAGSTGRAVSYAYPLADEHRLIILAPDSRDDRSWDLVLGGYGPDVDFLSRALSQTLTRCAVDRQRLAVGGHSDGASYALSFGIGAGDVFGHIMAFSPGVMTPVAAAGKPRVFISHGTRDPVMPIDDTSRKFVPRLRTLGYDVTYREYDGTHGAPPEIIKDGFDWLRFGRA